MSHRVSVHRWIATIAGAATLCLASSAVTDAGSEDPPPHVECAIPSEPIQLSSSEEAQSRLTGTWIRCETAPRKFIAFEGDDVGFEFTDGGRFFRIYRADDGSLIRSLGLHQEGRWQIDGVTEAAESEPFTEFSLQLHLLGSGIFSDTATFHDDPDALGIPMAGFHYYRWIGAEPISGVPDGIGEGPCGQPFGVVPIDSSQDIAAFLLGSWTICERNAEISLFGPDVTGFEFGEDGRFWELIRGPDGRVLRHEREPASTWEILPFDEPLPWGTAATLGVVRGGVGATFRPQLFSSPPFVRLDHMGVEEIRLLRGVPSDIPVTPTTTVPPTDTLPPTGRGPLTALVVAAGFLAMGGASWVVTRRRRDGASR